MKVRSHLLLLILASLIPVLVFSGVMSVLFHRESRSATERGLVETARALSLAVDAEAYKSTSVLRALAAAEQLETGDLSGFHRLAQTVLHTQPDWENVLVYAPSGQQLVNSQMPFGTALPMSSNPDQIKRVVETWAPAVSNLFRRPIAGTSAAQVSVPVFEGARLKYILAATLRLTVLTDLLRKQELPAGSIGTILDRNHVTIARTHALDQFMGQPATPDSAAKITQAPDGSFVGHTQERIRVVAAFARSPVTGWTVTLEVPASTVDAPLRWSLGLLAAGGVGCLLLGALAAVAWARRITRPIQSLAGTASKLVAGEPVEIDPTRVTEVDEVARAIQTASHARQEIEEKNAHLLAETERRRWTAESLAEIGRLISQSLDAERVGTTIVEAVSLLFCAPAAVLYRLEPDSKELVRIAGVGLRDWNERLGRGVGANGLAVSQRQPVISADTLTDPRITLTPAIRVGLEDSPYRAVLAVPLMVQDRVIGTLCVGDHDGRVFDAEETRIAQAFAHQAAVAIENARLHGEIKDRLIQSETLLTVGQQVSGTLDLTEMMRRVAKEVGRALGADMVGAFLADADHAYLRPIAGYHVPKHLLAEFMAFPIPLKGHRILEEAWKERQAVASTDVATDPRVDREVLKRFPQRSSLFCPMIVHDKPIGGFFVTWFEREHCFTPAELRLVDGICRQAGIGLANARLVEELKTRQARLEALLGVGLELSRIQPVESLLTRIAGACGTLLDASSAAFRLLEGEDLVLCGEWGQTEESLTTARLKIGESLTGAVAATGEPLVVQDPLSDPRLIPAHREAYRRLGIRAFLGVPVKTGDQIVGTLTVRTSRDEGFSAADVEMARAFASQAAIALSNARLVEELKMRQARLEALLELARQLSRIQPVTPLLTAIADACGRLLGTDSVGIRLVEGDDLVLAGAYGDAKQVTSKPRLKIGESFSGRVAASGEPLQITDPENDSRLIPEHRTLLRGMGYGAWLGVPIKVGERILGVLSIRTKRPEGFSTEDLAIMTAFAGQAAIALENSRLYQETQRALEELSHTQQQLSQAQKMEAIGQLAGGIAHDFNNLLTVITGRSHLLLGRLPSDDPARRDVELIQKTSDRAAALTRQLLAFSRKQVLLPKPLDLNALVGGLAPMLTRLIGEHIELVIVPGNGLGRVMADPGQLEQVVMNLLVNARDAMPDGGMVRIETENRHLQEVTLHAQGQIPPGPYVALSVHDTGCGMDPTTLTRIFEPFFTTKEPGKGTGLGLSSAYGIVHQSAGYIGVDSTVGRGTAVTIYLPRTALPSETPETQASAAALVGGQETILLVEDDEGVRKLASEVLNACGYTVLETGDPLEALVIGEHHRGPMHLLLTDMVMPAMRGPALAVEVLARHPDLRVLYMSGYADEMIGRRTVTPSGLFLQKPFTPDALARTVREALLAVSSHSSRRETIHSSSVAIVP